MHETAFVWAVTLAYFNGAINPFIYAYRYDDIGRELRVFVLNMKRKVIPGSHVEPCWIFEIGKSLLASENERAENSEDSEDSCLIFGRVKFQKEANKLETSQHVSKEPMI